LTTRFEERDGRLVISFLDTGVGIDPELAQRIFEPFFTTKREGIGLGLFLSKAIVERHGGTIAIAPREDERGTVVTFTLPAAGASRTASEDVAKAS
jgi:two-component system sensor histidine kinase DctS